MSPSSVHSSSRAVAVLASAFLVLGMYGVAPRPVAAQDYSPSFNIHPDGNNVWTWGWPAYVTLSVSFDRDGTSVHTDTVSTDADGNAPYQVPIDVQPGDVVTLADGTVTKTTTVTPITVDAFDTGADTVGGASWPDTTLTLAVNGTDVNRHATVGTDGRWSVDVGDIPDPAQPDEQTTVDLVAGSQGPVYQMDEDGDSTMIGWRVPNPTIAVHPYAEVINGHEFAANHPLTITRNGSAIDGGQVATDEFGNFWFDSGVDLTAGDLIVVDDGASFKDHTVTSLTWTGASAATDTITGSAAPGSVVNLGVQDADPPVGRTQTVIGDGHWAVNVGQPGPGADEGATADLVPGSNGWVVQQDGDGDSTVIGWRVGNPVFWVNRNSQPDAMTMLDFQPDTPLTVTRDGVDIDGGNVTTDHQGNVWDFWLDTPVSAGETFSVSDGIATKELVVADLTVTNMDTDADVISGTAASGTTIGVQVWGPGPQVERFDEPVDQAGNWSVNVGISGGPGEEETSDLVPGSNGAAFQTDPDGDVTRVEWGIANPAFNVHPLADDVYGWGFITGSEIVISRGPTLEDQTPLNGQLDWDQSGNFSFHTDTDIQIGEVIKVTDGIHTKSTIVRDIAIGGVDPESDTVWGTAEAGTLVGAWIWMTDFPGRDNVLVDSNGDWLIDFSVPIPPGEPGEGMTFDLVRGNHGAAGQRDEDGDSTLVDWRIAAPYIELNLAGPQAGDPNLPSIEGSQFEPGSGVTVTWNGTRIDDGSLMADEWGNFWMPAMGTNFAPGDEIVVDDGLTAKTLIVAGLAVTGVDLDSEMVFGMADIGATINLEVWDTGVWRFDEPVDAGGNWAVDVGSPGADQGEEATTDLAGGSTIQVRQGDDDGDATTAMWRVRAPAFNAHPDGDWIDGWDFAPNAAISIIVEGQYFEAGTDDNGGFWFGLGDVGVDLRAGDVVIVSDDTSLKFTTVSPIRLESVDPDSETVRGRGEPRTTVSVWVDDTDGAQRDLVVGTNGRWTADFAIPGSNPWEQGTADIGLGSSGGVQQSDPDGDSTMLAWRVPAPAFNVHPEEDWIDGWDFPSNVSLYVMLNNGVVGGTQTDEWGNFWFSLADLGIDAVAGDVIEVGDGQMYKDTTVTTLHLVSVNGDADQLVGTAEPGTDVGVWINDADLYRTGTVTAGGDWLIDVGVDGGVDIGLGSSGGVEQRDPDGDGTVIDWRIRGPAINVNPGDGAEYVEGWDFVPNTPIQLTYDGQPVNAGWLTTDEWGNFWFDFGENGFDLVAGKTVTAWDGETLKSVIITELAVTDVDSDLDIVSGTAEPGTFVSLWVDGAELEQGTDVLGDGTWAVSVGADLQPGASGNVLQTDEDGDATKIDWRVPAPSINVNPLRDFVDGWDFLPDTQVTVLWNGSQVDDGNLWTDPWGGFGLDLQSMGIDILPGDTIEATDGVSTKDTIVTNLALTDVDVDTDTLTGTAEPWSSVGASTWDSEAGRGDEPVGPLGSWSINLGVPGDDEWEWETYDIRPGSGGDVHQTDADGDSTVIEWRVPNPQFLASLGDNAIRGWDFGGPVTITIFDPATGKGDVWSGDEIGFDDDWFELWLDASSPGGWDLAPGQLVTVYGPEDTKLLTIADLAIGGWDFEANTIAGSTDQEYPVEVWVQSVQYGAWAQTWPDAGAWVVDIDDAQPWHQLRLLDEVWATQFDEDGDGTEVRTWCADERFTVDLVTQQVFGFDWPEGSSVDLKINNTTVATATAQTEGQNTMIPLAGTPNVYFELTPTIGLVHPGDTVTLTDGTTTKTQVIPDLTMNLADTEADSLSGTTTPLEAGGFLVVEPDWWTAQHEVVPNPDGYWATSWMGEWDITGNTGFALQTDADGDQTGTATPDPRVVVDPQANRIWALDFEMGGPLWLTITDDDGTVLHEAAAIVGENILYRGAWVRDMWAQPVGDLERPSVGLWDLTGVFDVQEAFVVTVSDGSSLVSTTVARLIVDSVDSETDTITGRSTGGVTFNLSEGGGYWGHHVDPVNGAWSYHFDATQFPYESLEPGDVVIAIADGTWTIVRSVVPEPSFHYDFGGFVKPILPPPSVNKATAGKTVKVSFSLGGNYGLDIFEAGSPTSVQTACPTGGTIGSPSATTGTLTYKAKTGLYTYTWTTPKAWKGSCRQLTFDFDDGSQQLLNFRF